MFYGMNSSRNWRIVVTDGAAKQIKRLPRDIAERIELVIESMRVDPFGGDIVKLGGGAPTWRRHIGAYRILFKILFEERIIFIREVIRRSSKTY